MDFMALTRSGDRLGWMERYTALIKSIHAEQFNLENMVGTSVDLTDLISNPNGYDPQLMIRRYEGDRQFI